VHFDLISYIFLCRYANRTHRMKRLTWCRVISLGGLVCLNISGQFLACIQNFVITLRVTTFFFRDVDRICCVCCALRRNFCEWSDCDFSSANSVCKHSCVLFFSAGISFTLFLRRRKQRGISTRWFCVEKINHSRDFSHVLRSLQAGFTYLHSYPRNFRLCLYRHRR